MNDKVHTNKRIINFLIDIIAISILAFLAFYLLSVLYLKLNLQKNTENGEIMRLDLFILIVVFIYYFVLESINGKTIGKYLTRTKVVKLDGSKPDLLNITLRSIIRIIPLDPFSYLFSDKGWHDRFSSTMVISDIK